MILGTVIRIRVDHKLRIAQSELPPDVRKHIEDALSIPNIARQKAMEQRIWGWERLPKTIELFEYHCGYLVMPRGFGFPLIEGLEEIGSDFTIDDRRVHYPIERRGEEIALRDHQKPAVEAILRAQEGIWKAPGASGKTVGVLEAIRRVHARSIVIVNTKDILWQWQDRAAEYLGEDFPVGQIGDDIFEVSDYMTIATAQTLHSRFEKLEREGFFDLFTFMCLDECHHAQAETYRKIVDRFTARFRIGVSATPDKTGDFALATNVLGPIIHETSHKDVSTLTKPTVYKIPTKFSFGYRGAAGRRPSNYSSLIKELVIDRNRNALIIDYILQEAVEDHHCLVVSRRLAHLHELRDMLRNFGFAGETFMLTGKESSEERQRIVDYASESPCVVFSTLADEALDIPRLDRLFLVFPQRNPGLITQQVARVERIHPKKKDAKIFDFCDMKVGPCEAQWRVRRLEVYQPRGYEIVTLRSS